MTVTEKSLSKKDLKFFWLFLKTMKLENEIKPPLPGGYWTLGDILLSKCKSSFTTVLMRRKGRTFHHSSFRGLAGHQHGQRKKP